jgi:secreted trypsin-like serine protease
MRRITGVAIKLVAVAALCMLLASGDARAITYGSVDTAGQYSNVGAFVVRAPDGHISPICSGTLISPSVFLTASHCTAYYEQQLAPEGWSAFVSFDSPIPFGDLTSPSTSLIPVVQVVTNPGYNQAQSDSGDIAVLLVEATDTRGITPATLPAAGLLDALAASQVLRDATFTNVGYGLQNRVVGGGQPTFADLNPIPRMFSFSTFDALNPGYLRLSQNASTGDGGTCFGDSGGPQFLDVGSVQTIVSITITGDAVCRATNVTYRLDTDSARAFLAPFVPLP